MISFRRYCIAAQTWWLLVGALTAAPQFVPGPQGPQRFEHSMAYDEARGVVVLFGGRCGWASGALKDETWEWDGVAWTQRSAQHAPSPRARSVMCYDAARGVCVLFGGVTAAGIDGETWEWDGIDWSLRSLATAPTPRSLATMVYDPSRSVSVLFGGNEGNNCPSGETWEYDGQTWLLRATTGPQARTSAASAYSSVDGAVLLFGGQCCCPATLSDTWLWDGAAWLQRAPSSAPVGLAAAGMCTLGAGAGVLLFGGSLGYNQPEQDGTYRWDGVDWQLLSPAVSPSRRQACLAYDALRQEAVVFGGWANPGTEDTWIFDGAEWRPKLQYVTSPINGHRYAMTPLMTWQDAEAVAVLEGGHLATIRTAAEQQWLAQNVGPSTSRYIGMTDAQVEGQWGWVSGDPVSYTSWLVGEPNNYAGAEDYGSMTSTGDWNDVTGADLWPGVIELLQPTTATSTQYGAGCGSPPLTMTPQAPPILGGAGSAVISNAPFPLGGVSIGLSDTLLAGLPILPLSLTNLGMSGCELLHSNDVFGLPVTAGAPGTLDFSYPIPTDATLLGAHAYLQAYCFAPAANPLQIIVSNGIDWTIGNQ